MENEIVYDKILKKFLAHTHPAQYAIASRGGGGGGGGTQLPDQSGHAGQFLTTDGTNLSWGNAGGSLTIKDEGTTLTAAVTSIDFVGAEVTATAVGNAVTVTISATATSPGGLDTQVQFNDSGSFGGDAGLVYNKTTDTLTVGVKTLIGTGSADPILELATSNTTNGDPQVLFTNPSNTIHLGMDNSDDDIIKMGTGTSIGSSTKFWLDVIGVEIGIGVAPSAKLHIYADTVDGQGVRIEQDGTGDPQVHYILTAGQQWVHGIDNSASDKFVFSADSSLGTETFSITTGGALNMADPATTRTNLGLVAGGAGDIWVEKAGDTMTGALTISLASGTPLVVNSDQLVVDADNLLVQMRRSVEINGTGVSGAQLVVYSTTNSVNADAGMYFQIQTGAATTQAFSLGADNTDDIFKISASTGLGTNDMLHLDTSGNMRNPGYLRVGSTSAPSNTTAGDITGIRLFAGTNQTEFTIANTGVTTITPSSNPTATLNLAGTIAASTTAALYSQRITQTFNITGSAAALIGVSVNPTWNIDATLSSATGVGVGVAVDIAATRTVTTFSYLNVGGDLSGTGTLTNWNGVYVSVGALDLVPTNVRGVRIDNLSSGVATTLTVGVDVLAQTGTGTNIGIRIAAPSGGSSNYALQLSDTGGTAVGGITFGTDVTLYRIAANVLASDDSMRLATYLRVGSTSAPTNVTAGDLTIERLNIADNAAFSNSGRFIRTAGTMTDTSGTVYYWLAAPVMTPVSNSTASVRTLGFDAIWNPATGITQTTLIGGFFQWRIRGDGTVSTIRGLNATAVVVDSSSAATATITTAVGVNSAVYSRPSGSTAATFTTAVAFDVEAVTTSGFTTTDFIGYRISANTSGTITNYYGIDIASNTRHTSNIYGIRLAFNGIVNATGATTDNIVLAIPTASVAMGNQTATTTNAHGISIGIPTWTSTTNTRTITNAAGLYIAGAPVASTNVTITNGPYSIWVDAGVSRFDGGIAIDGATAVNVTSGVYTPTRSSETNLDANVTMTEAQWMRVGNTVTVSGRFTADPTLTTTATNFEITLPVASNLGAAEDLAGTAFCAAIASQGAAIHGVVANDTAEIAWVATDVTSQTWSYTFSYQVI